MESISNWLRCTGGGGGDQKQGGRLVKKRAGVRQVSTAVFGFGPIGVTGPLTLMWLCDEETTFPGCHSAVAHSSGPL